MAFLKSKKLISAGILALILLWTVLVFWPALGHDFVNWGDDRYLLDNPHAQALTWENLTAIATTPVLRMYTPLPILSLAVEHHFAGTRPFLYHLDNLLLHLLVVTLVFFFARRLGLSVPAAALSALLFAIHPSRVESVAWVSQRKDVLCGVFFMGALIKYLDYLDRHRWYDYLVVVTLTALAVLSKPMALTLPMALWVCDWYRGRRISARILLDKLPLLFFLFPLGWWTLRMNQAVFSSPETIGQGLALAVWQLMFYPLKFFVPSGLGPLYSVPASASLWPSLLLAGIVLSVVRWRRVRPYVFAWLFYLATIFVVIRVSAAKQVGVVADRFMYLPAVGFCLLAGWAGLALLRRLGGRRPALVLVSAAVCFGVLGLSRQTHTRIAVWKDGETLWRAVLKEDPANVSANINLADYLLKEGVVNDEVVTLCQRVLAAKPDSLEAHVNLGNVYAQLGQYDQAIEHSRAALELDPANAVAHNNLGGALTAQGRYAEAIEHYQAALDAGYQKPGVYYNLGMALYNSGQTGPAKEAMGQAVQADPGFSRAVQALRKFNE